MLVNTLSRPHSHAPECVWLRMQGCRIWWVVAGKLYRASSCMLIIFSQHHRSYSKYVLWWCPWLLVDVWFQSQVLRLLLGCHIVEKRKVHPNTITCTPVRLYQTIKLPTDIFGVKISISLFSHDNLVQAADQDLSPQHSQVLLCWMWCPIGWTAADTHALLVRHSDRLGRREPRVLAATLNMPPSP